jgi:hypothetical protein
MKIAQVINVSQRHTSIRPRGKSGLRMGMAYAARKIKPATISGQSVARSQRRARAARSAASAVM